MNAFHKSHLLWVLGTTAPIYTMITVLMPKGIAGVPWIGLVAVIFLLMFLALLGFERSPIWNGLIAFIFWLPMIVLHLLNPGTVAISRGEVHKGVIEILAIGLIHALIQFTARFIMNKRHPEKTQLGAGADSSTASRS
ncbi:hypothetical protein [Gimesia aquarii]|uniref:Uncharacterized protein n=1 Tax=Gimesia aquarii TaxID=2527964 RepID=A0A517VP66_9PLAN|nr:hypothetical protein [Gimesia aquarii]QDT94808.1 hypothetical protein V144x_02400 [Gimesia aquarii]